MSAVFADTFYWIAFTTVQDRAHERVKTFTRSAKPDIIVTTEEVLTEYLNYFAAWGQHFRNKVAVNTQNIIENRVVRVVGQTPDSFRIGFDLYRARLDKGYSLTDCISMRTMRSEGITDVLTMASISSRKASGRSYARRDSREGHACDFFTEAFFCLSMVVG